MTHLFMIFLSIGLFIGDVTVIYLDEKPDDASHMTYLEMSGLDQLEACEAIMIRLEKAIKEHTKEQSKKVAKVYVVEQVRPQIQTESQYGRIGKVAVLFELQ